MSFYLFTVVQTTNHLFLRQKDYSNGEWQPDFRIQHYVILIIHEKKKKEIWILSVVLKKKKNQTKKFAKCIKCPHSRFLTP